MTRIINENTDSSLKVVYEVTASTPKNDTVLREKLTIPLEIKFFTRSRNDSGWEMEYAPINEIYGSDMTYAIRDGLSTEIWHKLHSVLEKVLGSKYINFIHVEENKPLIVECLQHCESRYGNQVVDFDKTGYDAVLIIK